MLKSDLLLLSLDQLKDKYKGSLNIANCGNAEVIGICDDSHSWFGGNMVVKISDSEVLVFMGHVCGQDFLMTNYDAYKATARNKNKPIRSEDFIGYLRERFEKTK